MDLKRYFAVNVRTYFLIWFLCSIGWILFMVAMLGRKGWLAWLTFSLLCWVVVFKQINSLGKDFEQRALTQVMFWSGLLALGSLLTYVAYITKEYEFAGISQIIWNVILTFLILITIHKNSISKKL